MIAACNNATGRKRDSTVVDADDGDQWILTGIHTVNRICYLITEVPHDWRDAG